MRFVVSSSVMEGMDDHVSRENQFCQMFAPREPQSATLILGSASGRVIRNS